MDLRIGRTGKRLTSLLLTLLLVLLSALAAQPTGVAAERATVALWNALVPLQSVNTFMNTGAHPDDENSALLAYLSRGVGARTISLIANRGEGGQNAIGTEYVTALGVVRTRELQEASKATGVEVIHLGEELTDSIWDFGFSKTPGETLAIWGHELTLERLVRAIRQTRPDVVMPSFRDSDGQHGHHRAMTVLTMEAYTAAADPTRFPEQIAEGLRPWQIKKLYLPAEAGGGGVYADSGELSVTVQVPVGEYDPMLGLSYVQLGEESRFYHRSQGMGRNLPEGPIMEALHLEKASVKTATKEQSIFDGLPRTVHELAHVVQQQGVRSALFRLQAHIDGAIDAYPNNQRVAAHLQRALAEVRKARAEVAGAMDLATEAGYDLDHRLALKEQQIQEALSQALLLVTRLQASQYELTRGSSATFTLTAFIGGRDQVEGLFLDLTAPAGWKVERLERAEGKSLAYNQTARATFRVTVPADAPYFDPYQTPAIRGKVTYQVGGVDVASQAEPQRQVAVLPDLSIRVQPDGVIYNLSKPGPFEVNVAATSYLDGKAETTLAPVVPEGWQVSPASAVLTFAKRGELKAAAFTLTPPQGLAAGRYPITFTATGKANSDRQVRAIEYDHIGRTYMVQPATVDVQAFAMAVKENLRVGYVASGFDSVPEALRQMGVRVELLSADTLGFGDLSVYDTIVIGIRAYRVRPDLVAANSRLLEYVKNGGNLVVQYHQGPDNWNPQTTAPYYLRIGSPSFDWRVTDENSEVRILAPDSPVLNSPNKIEAADWQGWVKDRGLYFPSEWAKEFTPVLSMNDTGEAPLNGSLLVAEFGEGRYVYTSLILYYQMEQRVPGAFRLFANLISHE